MTLPDLQRLTTKATCLAVLLLPLWAASHAAAKPADDAAADEPQPLGSVENPVRCDGVRAERYYLARLVDPTGEEITFSRIGSFGGGPYGNILDGYELEVGDRTIHVFIDMYHEGYQEDTAIEGFDIRCRYAWGLVIRADGLRYEIGADEPYDGEFTRTYSDTDDPMGTMDLVDGLLHGSVKQYDEEGVLRSDVPFHEGAENGLARFFDDRGWKRAEINYEDGQRHGPATWFNMDENVETQAQYEHGQPAGEWITYYPGGELHRVGSYRNGKRHGEWITYDGAGAVMNHDVYDEGEIIDPEAQEAE